MNSVSLVASIAALGVMGGWPAFTNSPARLTADDVARQFCALPSPQAQVGLEAIPDKEVKVQVPDENIPDPVNSPAIDVRLGDIVKLTVRSEQAGAAGVHGLSTIEAIHPGESIAIRFRAIYSGRFPLHFHGTDGSHFELMAINIRAEADARAHN
jgi:hypothetical protein